MRLIAGFFLLVFAAIVGAAEVLTITNSEAAQHVAEAFAIRDPFSPRGPLGLHAFSILLFLGFVTSGISLIRSHSRCDQHSR
jgi:hypothetical protein